MALQLSQELLIRTSVWLRLEGQTPRQFFQPFWIFRQFIEREIVDNP